jgi:FKBP-type peptidyl-prolyl cis-trans isomerase 2
MRSEAGELETFYVSEIEGGKLAGDGNHPLAGK